MDLSAFNFGYGLCNRRLPLYNIASFKEGIVVYTNYMLLQQK